MILQWYGASVSIKTVEFTIIIYATLESRDEFDNMVRGHLNFHVAKVDLTAAQAATAGGVVGRTLAHALGRATAGSLPDHVEMANGQVRL